MHSKITQNLSPSNKERQTGSQHKVNKCIFVRCAAQTAFAGRGQWSLTDVEYILYILCQWAWSMFTNKCELVTSYF